MGIIADREIVFHSGKNVHLFKKQVKEILF